MGKWKKVISTASHNGENYTGRQVGQWLILGLARNTGAPQYRQIWRCQCGCGFVREIDKSSVLSGRSVGCRSCTGKRHTGNQNPNWRGQGSIPSSFFTSLLNNARIRDIPVSITIVDVDWLWSQSGKSCALSGVPIEIAETASLDRIDSNGTYDKNNIQWVHKDIQLMKNCLPQERFVELCSLVATKSSIT